MSNHNYMTVNDKHIKVYTDHLEKLGVLQEYIDHLLVISAMLDYEVLVVNSSNFDDIIFMKNSNKLGIHFRHTFKIGNKSNTKIYCTHNDDVISSAQLKTLF